MRIKKIAGEDWFISPSVIRVVDEVISEIEREGGEAHKEGDTSNNIIVDSFRIADTHLIPLKIQIYEGTYHPDKAIVNASFGAGYPLPIMERPSFNAEEIVKSVRDAFIYLIDQSKNRNRTAQANGQTKPNGLPDKCPKCLAPVTENQKNNIKNNVKDPWGRSSKCIVCGFNFNANQAQDGRTAQVNDQTKPDWMMTDDEREKIGLSRKDQDSYNAFQDLARMLREHQALSPEQRMEKWKAWVEKDIAEKGSAVIPRFFINHYSVSLRKVGDKYEAFLNNFKAWKPADEPQYPDISKAKRNKPLASFATLEEASDWIKKIDDEQQEEDKKKVCPACENYIEDDEVGQLGIVVDVQGQRWHQVCLEQDQRANAFESEQAAIYDPQEELPSDRNAKSLWQMQKFSQNRAFGEPSTWTYHINLDERGSFNADVRNPSGKTMFEIKAGNELEPDETSIFEDGFVEHKHDMSGLKGYLVEMGIMSAKTNLVDAEGGVTAATHSSGKEKFAIKFQAKSLWELKKISQSKDTCPCKVCGKTTRMTGTKLCNRCWEVASAIRSNRESQSVAYMHAGPELIKLVKEKCNLRTAQSTEAYSNSVLDGMTRRQAANKVNAILHLHSKGVFKDEDWSNVRRIWKDLDDAGIEHTVTGAEYDHDSNGNPSGKTWKFEIDFTNNNGKPAKLYGHLIASFCGTVQDPTSKYDISVYCN